MKKTALLLSILFAFIFSMNAFSEKKPIDFKDYDLWKDLRGTKISQDGKFISYQINPQEGDGWLYIYEVATQKLDSIPRGYNASFSPNSNYLVFKIKPTFKETREAKLKKKKGDKLPQDSLGIYIFKTKSIEKIAKAKSFKLAKEKSDWFAFTYKEIVKKDTSEKVEKPQKEEEEEEKKKEKKKGKGKPKGNTLRIYNPIVQEVKQFKNVTDFEISKYGNAISFIQQKKDSVETSTVTYFSTKDKKLTIILEQEGISKKLGFDQSGENLAFVFSGDTAKTKVYSLYYSNKASVAEMIVDLNNEAMPKDWAVSENGNIYFDTESKNLFFGTAQKPVAPPKDTLTADEKVSVDIWNWKDNYLQPQQLLNRKKVEKRTYLAKFNLADRKMKQLGNEKITRVWINAKGINKYALGTESEKYGKFLTWEGKSYADLYLFDLSNGSKKLIVEKVHTRMILSPGEKYIYWYNHKELGWNVYDIEKGKIRNITQNINTNFWDELDDHPDIKPAYGVAGWLKDDRYILIYDRYDIWKVDPKGEKAAINLTNGYGKQNKTILRYRALDDKRNLIEEKDLLLVAYSEATKQSGFYTIKTKKAQSPIKLMFGDFSVSGRGSFIAKAKNSSEVIFKKGNLQNYPELYLSDLSFKNLKKLSNTNPQQKNYNWATVDLIQWTSLDGKKLDGLLYKPENFDPNKKYPMVIYFYERMSNRRFTHIIPKPSRSSINFIHFASNGYLVFIPDIVYKDGYPGESAVNAVVSGTTYLIEKYDFINKDKIGIQGQSWGGYQVAYLVTQTDIYAAAWAGAPVSNMTSAYGGIRWGSGMNRAFQYERTQSRIGGSLWEKPRQYIENSPIFLADKINTPLAIMHNDKDGAVPWYQGIELFCGLRRLEKPVWMLNYNGAPHNLSRRADSKDISIRLSQFFDHFLKDKPAPVWIEYGVPAVKKGKDFGLELVE